MHNQIWLHIAIRLECNVVKDPLMLDYEGGNTSDLIEQSFDT